MKRLILLVIIFAITYSCSKDEDENQDLLTFKGKWNLVKMTGSFSNSETTGADMEWQENYILNNDYTLSKTRSFNDTTITATGTYKLLDKSDLMNQSNAVKFLEVTFKENNSIIANCYSQSLTEYLYFSSDLKLRNIWNECDGSGLEYAKEEF